MSKCYEIEDFESIRPDNVGTDAQLLKTIVQSLSLNSTYPDAKANEYVGALTPQFTIPILIACLCLIGAIFISCASCFKYKNTLIGKRFSRYCYLINAVALLVSIVLSIYFAAATTNSLLNGSCQFENSRIKADLMVTNLHDTAANITDSLDDLVTKVVGSLGDTKPSVTMEEYTTSLNNLHYYASITPSCLLPECTIVFDLYGSRTGLYTCALCLNPDPVSAVSSFIQTNVQPTIEKNEEYLDLIDANFVQAKDIIKDGLKQITDIQTSTLSKDGVWGDASTLMIDTTYEINNTVWTLFFVFIFIFISLFVSVDPSPQVNYVRTNVITWCSCINIISVLAISAVLLPLITVSTDVCFVLNDIPTNTSDYYVGSQDVVEIVQRCFGDGKLPEQYTENLDFVDVIGDCPKYDLDAIFDNLPTGTLRAVVDSMNSFTLAEISAQANVQYKQRMTDIMEIKALAEVTYEKEEELKNTVGTTLGNVQQICQDLDPLFTLVKNSIYNFSCSAVGSIYYTTLKSICVDTSDSILSMLLTMFLLAAFGILFVLGSFVYFVTEDQYAYSAVKSGGEEEYRSLYRTKRF